MVQPKYVVVAVDDDPRVRESIQSLLESAGYAVRLFASAEEFLESGALGRSHCVIADVRLPGIDGIELQHRIRSVGTRSAVIFITAHDDEDVRKQALAGGAVAFMVKPFDGVELLETIELAVDGR